MGLRILAVQGAQVDTTTASRPPLPLVENQPDQWRYAEGREASA